jgi:hypothetical protein
VEWIILQVYIYNNSTGKIEKYQRELNEPMPYTSDKYLTVREFRGSSNSPLVWSDRRALETFDKFRKSYGKPIPFGFAFKRIWEGGHGTQSQHYAGTAFDVGQALSADERNRLRELARAFGEWSYVEPASLTPTWVHLDKRLSPPACPGGGYISLSQGMKGVYVLVLQDALNALGYKTGGLDGIFGNATKEAVANFQRANGLAGDGIVGCATWRALTQKVKGMGKTPTVIMG